MYTILIVLSVLVFSFLVLPALFDSVALGGLLWLVAIGMFLWGYAGRNNEIKAEQIRKRAELERDIAKRGGGWDGLELGKWYKVYVVSVPYGGERTSNGKPVLPVCRVKDDDGKFIGRYIVTEVDEPVRLGQELMVLLTNAHESVVFATTDAGQ
jgi:hypothetical protein